MTAASFELYHRACHYKHASATCPIAKEQQYAAAKLGMSVEEKQLPQKAIFEQNGCNARPSS